MGLPPCCKHKGEIISFFTEQQEDGLSQTLSVGDGGGVGGAEFITTKWPHSTCSVPKKHSQCTMEKENPSGQECKVVLAWQSLQALRKTLKFRPPRSPTEKTPRNLNSWSITTTLIRKQITLDESSQEKTGSRIRTTKVIWDDQTSTRTKCVKGRSNPPEERTGQ